MIEQFAIAGLGVSAIWLSQCAQVAARHWAPVLGLAGQPFWFYAAFQAQQWGILVLCGFYTLAWAKGTHTHWFKETVHGPGK